MKRRIILLALTAAAVSATTIATSPAFGDNEPRNILRIDDQYHVRKQVTVTEYGTSGRVLHAKTVSAFGGSRYWLVDTNTGWLTITDDSGQTGRTPGSGVASSINQFLPVCYIIDTNGALNWAKGARCTTHGATQESWR